MVKSAINGLDGLAARLRQAVKDAGGNSVVSEISGVPPRSLTNYLGGKNEPPVSALSKIASACRVSLDWLATGENATSSYNRPDVAQSGNEDWVLVPIRDIAAAAGAGMINHGAEIIDRLPFSRAILRRYGVNPDRAEFIRAAGDSMEPTIRNGDLVLVDRSKREVRADAIYAIDVGEDVRIKRIRQNFDGSLTLISDNKSLYPEERLSSADAEHLQVRGRVLWTEKVL